MANDVPFWYKKHSGSGLTTDLPPQAIPLSKKKDKWKKATMDALERIGIQQFHENRHFADYFRMSDGKVSYMELATLMPQLREVDGLMDKLSIPTDIKHYDLLGIITNYLQSVIMDNVGTFYVEEVGEVATTDRKRKQTELLQQYWSEEWNKQLTIKLLQAGVNPNETQFRSEEEKQQYIANLNQQKEALTPPEIKDFISKTFTTVGVEWANKIIERDSLKFNENENDRLCARNYLHTGRCFKEYKLTYDGYTIEPWSPINTFISKTIDCKYPQKGEYIGRIHFYTPSDFINKKGYHFTSKVKEKILNSTEDYGGWYDESPMSFEDGMANGFSRTAFVPSANYYDHEFLVGLEEEFGVPLARRTIYKKDGTTEQVADFLPRRNTLPYGNTTKYASYLRDDMNLRSDMIMVTEAYFRSYQRVGYLSYIKADGSIGNEIVTDELLEDFLKDNGIKTITTIAMKDIGEKQPVNTIIWDYVPQVWKGEKACTSTTNLGEDLYYNIEPLEYQIKGDNSNIYEVELPVAGLVSKNPADKIIPYQNLYNINKNKEYKLHEQELGLFLIFDTNFLPSDIKEYGDTETSLLLMNRIIKDTGLFGLDSSAKNIKGGSLAFNTFERVDMTLGSTIIQKQQISEYYKQKAYEQFGITPPALGEPVKYMTATGVDQSVKSTQSQTDYLYEDFSNFKLRSLHTHLCLAQYAQGNGHDISLEYTNSDLENIFFRVSDPKFSLRNFNIIPISDSKKRRELEQMKQYMLNQNTMEIDPYELSGILNSDSMVQLMNIAKLERARRDLIRQREAENNREIEQMKIDAAKQEKQDEFTRTEYSKQKDRENKLEIERIDALGRDADNQSNVEGLNYINNEADRALAKAKQDQDYELKLQELDRKIQEQAEKYKQSEREFALKVRELDLKDKQLQTQKEIAMMNKN